MSRKYCLLATEGPHDQAAIARLLQLSGLKKFNGVQKELDLFWEGFIPNYPKGGNLYTRMDMPSILTSPTHSIAIYCGEGSKLVQNLIAIVTNHPRYAQEIHAFGLIVDTDNEPPQKVAKEKAEGLRGSFPTNKRSGALDSILAECASVVYPDHKKGATQFINDLDGKHTKHLNLAAKDKTVVACIVSILKPGSTNTSSIAKDDWICGQTIDHKDVASFYLFLKDLLELPS
ncbi:MAG: hypothetical protein E6J34_01185 [Chloroflexi bacterium]|nr:MAG: hypothetical protein E6J34_01185 [Chloroflexota bacterium]